MLLSVECEFPAVLKRTLGGVHPETFLSLWKQLAQEGWRDEGFGVSRSVSFANPEALKAEQTITTDTGPTIEIAPSPSMRIQDVDRQLKELRGLMVDKLDPLGVAMAASGVHPGIYPNTDDYYRYRTPRGPYDYAIRERGWNHWTVLNICATQEVIDVPVSEAIRVLKLLHRLAGLFLFLFRNDPDLCGTYGHCLSVRPGGWRRHVPGVGPFRGDVHKVWLPMDEVKTWEHYLRLIWEKNPMFMIGTKNKGLVFVPEHPTFWDFLTKTPKDGWKAKTVMKGKELLIHPSIAHIEQSDWTYMGFARVRWHWKETDDEVAVIQELQACRGNHGFLQAFFEKHLDKVMIENRSIATGPKGEELASLALITGLIENIESAEKLSHDFDYCFWLSVARAAEYLPFDTQVEGMQICELIAEMIKTARDGLVKRGFGEESYLAPLHERLSTRLSPSEQMLLHRSVLTRQEFVESLFY